MAGITVGDDPVARAFRDLVMGGPGAPATERAQQPDATTAPAARDPLPAADTRIPGAGAADASAGAAQVGTPPLGAIPAKPGAGDAKRAEVRANVELLDRDIRAQQALGGPDGDGTKALNALRAARVQQPTDSIIGLTSDLSPHLTFEHVLEWPQEKFVELVNENSAKIDADPALRDAIDTLGSARDIMHGKPGGGHFERADGTVGSYGERGLAGDYDEAKRTLAAAGG